MWLKTVNASYTFCSSILKGLERPADCICRDAQRSLDQIRLDQSGGISTSAPHSFPHPHHRTLTHPQRQCPGGSYMCASNSVILGSPTFAAGSTISQAGSSISRAGSRISGNESYSISVSRHGRPHPHPRHLKYHTFKSVISNFFSKNHFLHSFLNFR